MGVGIQWITFFCVVAPAMLLFMASSRLPVLSMADKEYEYIYSWHPRGNLRGAMSRKGERCRVLVRGGWNSALVEFQDGYLAVVSQHAIRKKQQREESCQMKLTTMF